MIVILYFIHATIFMCEWSLCILHAPTTHAEFAGCLYTWFCLTNRILIKDVSLFFLVTTIVVCTYTLPEPYLYVHAVEMGWNLCKLAKPNYFIVGDLHVG